MGDWKHPVIARRELRRGEGPVIVSIGLPYQPHQDEPHTWFCPFMIEGLDKPVDQYSGGVDAVQALELGMKMIGDVLAYYNKDGAITWDGHPDLGFPRH